MSLIAQPFHASCEQQRLAANRQALQQAAAVYPLWTGVAKAAEAVQLEPKTLLHAGPPFADACRPSAPVLSSAILCCLYEGWARTEDEAEALIVGGEVRLHPAQDYGVVTPLAAVISPSTHLLEVTDLGSGARSWSLLGSGCGPQLRFGSRDCAVLERLAFRDQTLAPLLQAQLRRQPIGLIPLAISGISGGDDLHYQTTVANRGLHQQLLEAGADARVLSTVAQAPLFFLTLWMASCQLIAAAMSRGAAAGRSSLVVALAGNGESMGLRLSSNPAHWWQVPAPTPKGPAALQSEYRIAAALGDSGVIDAMGFGAQLWHRLAGISAEMGVWNQRQTEEVKSWMSGSLDSLAPESVYSGLDIFNVKASGSTPTIALAMLEQQGRHGLIGKGVASVPMALIGKAIEGYEAQL